MSVSFTTVKINEVCFVTTMNDFVDLLAVGRQCTELIPIELVAVAVAVVVVVEVGLGIGTTTQFWNLKSRKSPSFLESTTTFQSSTVFSSATSR
jgi:hypothetical protein